MRKLKSVAIEAAFFLIVGFFLTALYISFEVFVAPSIRPNKDASVVRFDDFDRLDFGSESRHFGTWHARNIEYIKVKTIDGRELTTWPGGLSALRLNDYATKDVIYEIVGRPMTPSEKREAASKTNAFDCNKW